MHYTPIQVREATGIPPETLRYWRKTLSFLPGGTKPRYEPGDLLALAVVKTLCEDVGMTIKSVARFGEPLFSALKAEQWGFLRSRSVVVDVKAATVDLFELIPPSLGTSCVVLSLEHLILDLTAKLTAGANLDSQTVLSFPSNAIRR